MARIHRVGHWDRLTLVEHLDELRARIIISITAFGVAFGLCFWQNHKVLDLLNDPLPHGKQPITFGVTEPFVTTMTVCAYAAIVISLPVILYQLYAFVLPAFSSDERRVALPILILIPALFLCGVVFGDLVVLRPAVHFLLNFNDSEFNVQVRASDYYTFVALLLLSMGLLFQVPMGILAATRVGLATPAKLRKWRPQAILVAAVVAALLPTVDPVSMILEMVPLVVLYELSIVLASVFGGTRQRRAKGEPTPEGTG